MPRLFSAGLIHEKNQLESTHAFSMAFQLDIDGAPAPFRLVNYDQDIVFHGQTFERFPCDIDTLEDATSASIVTLQLTIANVDQQLQSLLENYWAPVIDPQWMVTIWQIDCMDADLTDLESGEVFSVSKVSTDFLSAQVDLQAEGITLGRIVPGRRYTTSGGFLGIPRR